MYHISDKEKVDFTLNAICNHLQGVGNAAKLDINVVIHGPALEKFHDTNFDIPFRQNVLALQSYGVTFTACSNTMSAQSIDQSDLLPDFQIAEKGGVVKIMELESRGYLYIRP